MPILRGELIDHAFDPEHHLRHAGRAEGIHLRAVRHDLVGDGLDVLEVVAREHRLRRVDEHRAGEGAGLEDNSASAAVMVPSLFTPILTRDCVPDTGPVARNTSLRVSVIFTGRLALRASRIATGSP